MRVFVGYQPAAIATNAYLRSAETAGAHVVLTKPFEVEVSASAMPEQSKNLPIVG